MKLRAAIFLAFLAVGGFAWWFLRPAADASKLSGSSRSASARSLFSANSANTTTKIAPPKLPAASTTPAASSPASTAAATPKVDAQKELATVIPDLSNLLLTGDLVTAFENYTPPDNLAQIPSDRLGDIEDQLRNIVHDPAALGRIEMLSHVLELLRFENPELNVDKDAATYSLPGLGGMNPLSALHLQKVNDRWYIRPDDIDNLGDALGLRY